MEPSRWRRIDKLFNAAADLPPSDRSNYLERECDGDSDLRAEVESLLAADADGETDFRAAIADAARDVVQDDGGRQGGPAGVGDVIGDYRLIRKLGEGGMGAVYLGERADEQFTILAAVKLLRSAAAHSETLARFRSERQILANLNHPFIARLLDGGAAPDGSPYVVMEYVDGLSLVEYCDRAGLPVRERLALFRKVLEAVDYAHRNLIVHRDLKPANILVTGDGTPKLLDFGIAKILGENAAGPAVTGPLGRVMTPAYASPEQVLGRNVGLGSDVYSLGVTLYELLVGAPPYRLDGATPGEIERTVCEADPPPPSRAVPDDPEVARQRGVSADELRRSLRGELDDILLTALAKDPEKRYPSAERFSADLRRWLEGLPVMAVRQTWAYRAGKFVRRNKAAVAAAAVFLLLLGSYAASVTFLAGRLEQERDSARRERDRAAQTVSFLADIFRISDPGETRGNRVTAREILDWGAEKAELELDAQPQLQAELLDTIGVVYRNLGLYAEADRRIARALELRRSQQPPDIRNIAASLNHLAKVRHDLGRYQDAEPLYRESLDLTRALAPEGDAAVAQNLNDLAMLARDQGDYNQAEALAREALALRRRVFGGERPEVSAALHNLGTVLYRQGDYPAAEELFREALELDRAIRGDLHPDVAAGLSSLGALLRQTGRREEAEQSFREALSTIRELYGDRHTGVANSLRNLAEIRREQGRLDEARDNLEEALRLDRELYGKSHPSVAADLNLLGMLLQQRGDDPGAKRRFEESLEMRRALLPAGSPPIANSLLGLGSVLTNTGRPGEAEPLLSEALEIFSGALPADHWQIAETRAILGLCLTLSGRYVDAETTLLANTPYESEPSPQTRRTLEALAYLYDSWGRSADAEKARQALAASR